MACFSDRVGRMSRGAFVVRMISKTLCFAALCALAVFPAAAEAWSTVGDDAAGVCAAQGCVPDCPDGTVMVGVAAGHPLCVSGTIGEGAKPVACPRGQYLSGMAGSVPVCAAVSLAGNAGFGISSPASVRCGAKDVALDYAGIRDGLFLYRSAERQTDHAAYTSSGTMARAATAGRNARLRCPATLSIAPAIADPPVAIRCGPSGVRLTYAGFSGGLFLYGENFTDPAADHAAYTPGGQMTLYATTGRNERLQCPSSIGGAAPP